MRRCVDSEEAAAAYVDEQLDGDGRPLTGLAVSVILDNYGSVSGPMDDGRFHGQQLEMFDRREIPNGS